MPGRLTYPTVMPSPSLHPVPLPSNHRLYTARLGSRRPLLRNFAGRPNLMHPKRVSARQTLIFDADDTLWENNIYFERAIEEFLDFLDHSHLSRAEIRATFDEIERATATVHGYGAAAFGHSLRACYERLAGRELDASALATVMGFAERILIQEIQLIEGVAETLAQLAQRHDLTLFTKGRLEEQRSKIERSGIRAFFAHYEVTPEKTTAAYLELVTRLGADPATTWMIGNSPRSDINPALAAGLNTVFIPHTHTWKLEHDAIPPEHDRLILLDHFRQLLDLF